MLHWRRAGTQVRINLGQKGRNRPGRPTLVAVRQSKRWHIPTKQVRFLATGRGAAEERREQGA